MSFAGVMCVIIATVFMLATLWNAISAVESKRWPEAPGVISASYVEKSYIADEGTQYTPIVVYRYRIGGLDYIGKRISFGNSNASITKKYRSGQEVIVRYNPENPEQCVLEPGLNRSLVIQFVGTWVVIVVGAYFL